MKIIEGGRGTGRTTQLVLWVRRFPNRVLVVHSETERDRILKDYFNTNKDQVITIQAVLDGRLRGRNPRPILGVDNLDLILPYVLGNAVGPVMMTREVEDIARFRDEAY